MATIHDAEILTPGQVEHAWWDAWYKEDYSWEGLAKKPWVGFSITTSGHLAVSSGAAPIRHLVGHSAPRFSQTIERPATLQDYWRLDEYLNRIRSDDEMGMELLKAQNGRTYHIAHYPIINEDGTSTGKLDWDPHPFRQITIPRLDSPASRGFGGYDLNAPLAADFRDYRAQFQGTVIISSLDCINSQLTILFTQSYFAIQIAFSNQMISDGAYFTNALFCKPVNFSNITIKQIALFNKCNFMSGVDFSKTNFERFCSFENSVFFGKIKFQNLTTQKFVSFRNTQFFALSPDEKSEVDFTNCSFQNVDFNKIVCTVRAWFQDCEFAGNADFSGSIFSILVQYDGSKFHCPTFFNYSQFQSVSFVNCNFSSAASFGLVSFSDSVVFSGAVFKSTSMFTAANFAGKMAFKDAVFSDVAHFEDIVWPSSPASWSGTFDRALFKSHAVFTGAKCQSFSAFNGAKLERGIRFDPGDEASNRRRLKKELALNPIDGRAHVQISAENRKALLVSLEGGCRVLKQAMAYDSNPLREQEFYRFELMARRAHRDTISSERIISFLYDEVSHYGSSFVRPLIYAICVLLGCGAFYLWILHGRSFHLGWPIDWGKIIEAFSLSLSRMLPFGAFEAASSRVIGQHPEVQISAEVLLCLRLIATLQSIVSLGLTFLFGLALRRKFQMS